MSRHGVEQQALIVARYGEIFIKGANRRRFEDALRRNVADALKAFDGCAISRAQGRLFVELDPQIADAAVKRLQSIFGISSLSIAVCAEANLRAIERAMDRLLAEHQGQHSKVRRFKIAARRSDKQFETRSIELARRLGDRVQESKGWRVDLEQPDLVIGVEVGAERTFVFDRRLPGAGGLPVGTTGDVVLLLSGGIDSPVAGHLLQKRGTQLRACYFHSPPFTGEGAKDKVVRLATLLAKRQRTMVLHVVPFTAIQQDIKQHCPADTVVVHYRRAMMRIASRIARQHACSALGTGENLGQVASQTLKNLACIEATADLPVLRPLLSYDKQEIIALAESIGSYKTSIEAHPDCCSLFVPKHPSTGLPIAVAEEGESKLQSALLDQALRDAETIQIA